MERVWGGEEGGDWNHTLPCQKYQDLKERSTSRQEITLRVHLFNVGVTFLT